MKTIKKNYEAIIFSVVIISMVALITYNAMTHGIATSF
jgi:hypothetical protein